MVSDHRSAHPDAYVRPGRFRQRQHRVLVSSRVHRRRVRGIAREATARLHARGALELHQRLPASGHGRGARLGHAVHGVRPHAHLRAARAALGAVQVVERGRASPGRRLSVRERRLSPRRNAAPSNHRAQWRHPHQCVGLRRLGHRAHQQPAAASGEPRGDDDACSTCRWTHRRSWARLVPRHIRWSSLRSSLGHDGDWTFCGHPPLRRRPGHRDHACQCRRWRVRYRCHEPSHRRDVRARRRPAQPDAEDRRCA